MHCINCRTGGKTKQAALAAKYSVHIDLDLRFMYCVWIGLGYKKEKIEVMVIRRGKMYYRSDIIPVNCNIPILRNPNNPSPTTMPSTMNVGLLDCTTTTMCKVATQIQVIPKKQGWDRTT